LQVPAAEEAQFKLDNPNFESLISNSTYITESTPVEKLDDPVEKQELIDKFVDARITYATMVSNMDTNIGRLVIELKKDMTKFNNTVIIFLSDNGGYTNSKGAVNYPLDAGKGSVRDGGHKVTMFVSWPDKISPATYDHQISSLDLYPTLIGFAGESVPAGKIIDGVDFMDAMIDGDDARPDEGLLVMRPQNGFHNGAFAYENYKIVKIALVLLKHMSATTKTSISNRTWRNGSSQFTGDYSVDDIWTWYLGEALAVGGHFILDSDGLGKAGQYGFSRGGRYHLS